MQNTPLMTKPASTTAISANRRTCRDTCFYHWHFWLPTLSHLSWHQLMSGLAGQGYQQLDKWEEIKGFLQLWPWKLPHLISLPYHWVTLVGWIKCVMVEILTDNCHLPGSYSFLLPSECSKDRTEAQNDPVPTDTFTEKFALPNTSWLGLLAKVVPESLMQRLTQGRPLLLHGNDISVESLPSMVGNSTLNFDLRESQSFRIHHRTLVLVPNSKKGPTGITVDFLSLDQGFAIFIWPWLLRKWCIIWSTSLEIQHIYSCNINFVPISWGARPLKSFMSPEALC